MADRALYAPPAGETTPSIGEVPRSFAEVNRRGQTTVATTAATGLLLTVLVGGLFFYSAGAIAGAIASAVTALIAAAQVFRTERRRLKLGTGGITVGGEYVPWSSVFMVEALGYMGGGHLFDQNEHHTVYVGFHDGRELRAVSLEVGPELPPWCGDAQALVRPPAERTPDEQAFVGELFGAVRSPEE
jgi:hypothetical protein